ncbi:glutathione transferase GstA [Jannaschia pohangensis]|uniref:Glutathione S-transferase n=1 Tax=Jannaschia pohangensis TaxID=390807 RepID=A0A1I3U0L8_9RHOB|nr:glutathione transferase GstA [Jannaschia pohangensis]SFJ75446.1 glutathione S-transferase [Jannaschia pohangensis]
MKLFYKPGACSLASHIALIESGVSFDIDAVSDMAGRTESGVDYTTVNPKGYVPALQLDTGDILTEGPAILQFVADTYLDAGLMPAVGTMARARTIEHLVFVSSELHKAFAPMFKDTADAAEIARARSAVIRNFDVIENILADGRPTLVEGQFTVADVYLFVVANWANFKEIDLADWPHLAGYMARIAARPSVQRAMRAEGLL